MLSFKLPNKKVSAIGARATSSVCFEVVLDSFTIPLKPYIIIRISDDDDCMRVNLPEFAPSVMGCNLCFSGEIAPILVSSIDSNEIVSRILITALKKSLRTVIFRAIRNSQGIPYLCGVSISLAGDAGFITVSLPQDQPEKNLFARYFSFIDRE